MKTLFATIVLSISSFISQLTGINTPTVQAPQEPVVQQQPAGEVSPSPSLTPSPSPFVSVAPFPSVSPVPPKGFPSATITPPNKISPDVIDIRDTVRSVEIIHPLRSQSFGSSDKVKIEARVVGKPTKVIVYVGSGSILKTLTQPPYIAEYDISTSGYGKYKNYRLPLEVRAFRKNGTYASASSLINIVPSELNNPDNNNVPSEQRNISFDNINFVSDFATSLPDATANGTYTVEAYDSFSNFSSIKTKVWAKNLKPNTAYVLFAMTKNGQLDIGSMTTDANGSGQFFTGLGSDQHYCDIYGLGIKEKSIDKAELWSQGLSSKCQRG